MCARSWFTSWFTTVWSTMRHLSDCGVRWHLHVSWWVTGDTHSDAVGGTTVVLLSLLLLLYVVVAAVAAVGKTHFDGR